MLILSRKVGEQIQIGPDIVVTVVRVTPTAIRLGVAAPAGVAVVRSEIRPAPVKTTTTEPAWQNESSDWP